MEELEGGSSHEHQDDTSTASQTAKRPARRRRLAHRRQYAKSRGLDSSFLRSQFVRYDALSHHHDSADDAWQRAQTFDVDLDTATNAAATTTAAAATDGPQQHQRQPYRHHPQHHHPHSHQASPHEHLATYNSRILSGGQRASGVVTEALAARAARASCHETTARLLAEHHHSSSMPSPRLTRATDTIAASELDTRLLADYSSSSLDSYSLVDSQWDDSYCNIDHPIAGRQTAPHSPFVVTHNPNTHSLSYLPNIAAIAEPQDATAATTTSLVPGRQSQQQATAPTTASSSHKQQRPVLVERVVRSETVDLNRIRLQQHSESSPRARFFSGQEYRSWLSSEQHHSLQLSRPQLSPRIADLKSPGSRSVVSTSEPGGYSALHHSVDQITNLRDRHSVSMRSEDVSASGWRFGISCCICAEFLSTLLSSHSFMILMFFFILRLHCTSVLYLMLTILNFHTVYRQCPFQRSIPWYRQ